MVDLVALAIPAGPDFVRALSDEWEKGNAVAPIDARLTGPERDRVLSAVKPTHVISAAGDRTPLDGGEPAEPGDALVVATSGTSGLPKAVVLEHHAVESSARLTSSRLNIDPAIDRWLCCLPVSHIGGLSVITRALLTGTPLTVHPRFDPSAVTDAVRNDGVTRVSLVTRALAQVDSSMFTTVLLGGAAPPPDRPANVIATYGSTETGSGIVYERAALDGVELRADDDGQLWVRSPTLLRCYRDGFDPKDAAGWYPTGDAGTIQDGVLSVQGRIGDVIVSGGEKIWPVRIEPIIRSLPGVVDAVVLGRPDNEWGHEVVAVVEGDVATAPSLEQIRDAVRAELPDWWAPRSVRVVSSFPRTALGKIRRSEVSPHEPSN